MPASISSMWFITVSPCEWTDIDQKMVASQSQIHVEYHVIKEYGSDGDHPHLHAYLNGVEESQEKVRRRWMKCLPKESDFKIALKVVKCTNRDRLIGAYFSKESKHEVLYSNMRKEELQSLQAEYAHINKAKANQSKYKYPKLQAVPDEVDKYIAAHELGPIYNYAQWKQLLRRMMKDGYNFINITGRLKHAWVHYSAVHDIEDPRTDDMW